MNEKIQAAIEALIKDGNSEPCRELICDEGCESPAIAKAAFDADIFYPPLLYQYAAPETRDALIHLLDDEGIKDDTVNQCLTALAFIGDETVQKYFMKWEKHPPVWSSQLYQEISEFALDGGWCVEDGHKKTLFFEDCYALEEVSECDAEENVFGGACDEKCPYCGSSYMNKLIVDGRDKRLSFLGIKGRIKIKYCDSCLPWEDYIYCSYVEDGESTMIHRVSGQGEFFSDEELNQHAPYILSKTVKPVNYCDDFHSCAIGGRPNFIYGYSCGYADCPKCGKKMKHLAQLNWPYTENGTEYIEICTNCKIAAVTYQNT